MDRTKPYQLSLGHPFIKYIQDGKLYNAQGIEIDENGKSPTNEREEVISNLRAAKISYDGRKSTEALKELLNVATK